MARKINKEGLEHIKRWEGLKLKAYKCPADIWTIGYGSTGPHVHQGLTISRDEAERLLIKDLERFERAVEQAVKVPLNDNQFATLVSFAFNVGEGAFQKSTLLRKLNREDYDAVPRELMKWVNGGGKRLQGLVNRRAAEGGLWAKGSFVSSNTEEAKPEAPPIIDKETVSWGAGILSTLAAAFSGTGPIQWALAGVIIISFGIGAYLFLSKRLNPS